MNPARLLACTAALSIACAGAAAQVSLQASGAAATAPKGGYVAPDERKPLPPATEALLKQINALRAAGAVCGTETMAPAAPVQWHDALERAAEIQVRHVARLGDLTHTGADGSSVGQRVTAQGFEWSRVGENAAAGNATASGTLAQWMKSPGHCSNLMGPQFTVVAVSGLPNPATVYKHYWVMVLATPMR